MIIQPRPFNLRKTLTVLSVLLVAFYFYYQRQPPLRFWNISGAKWSQYSVKFTDNRLTQADVQQLKADIDLLLDNVNQQMSTYIPDSEISLFNEVRTTDPQPVSAEFAELIRRALEICNDTGGAFNPTLDHLINIWGFGRQGPGESPSDSEVTLALSYVGCDKVEVLTDSTARKQVPETTLNLNAIAEGWAVDKVARLLEHQQITNYYVEIGGEVFAKGLSEKARKWRVGIDRPVEGASPGETYDIVVETDGIGLATSGNYRNYSLNEQGVKIAHILDPRIGRPTTTRLASVSVIAPDCATADAVATALFVMGTDEGIQWTEKHPGIETVFITHTEDGSQETTFSSGFTAYTISD